MRKLAVSLILLIFILCLLCCYSNNNIDYNPAFEIKAKSVYTYKGCKYAVDEKDGYAYKTRSEVVAGKTYLIPAQRDGYYILVEVERNGQ